MDKKNLIIAIVVGVLLVGGVGFAVMRNAAPPPAPAETPVVPASQLTNEIPPEKANTGSDGQTHSTE